MFTRDLVQAVSDWQRGGSREQKAKRGAKLRAEVATLPAEFRECALSCFRQIALDKGSLWSLADEPELPETISAWTLALGVAREFKNGVPPPGSQGVIFAVHPIRSVVANLDRLFRDAEFVATVEKYGNDIVGYYDGIDRYRNRQREVVLEIESVRISDIWALGGCSSTRDELVRMIYGPNATSRISRNSITSSKLATRNLRATG